MKPDLPLNNLVIIICGPAGSGKTTLCDRLLAAFPNSISRLVTTTSREPRPGETDGVDYHFLDEDVFKKKIQDGSFIEWASVHGRYYGSQKAHLEQLLQTGKDILLNIDVQGAEAFRKEAACNPLLEGKLLRIFIKPKSIEQIRERLRERGSDDEKEIERRLKTAQEEIRLADSFDRVIVSGTRDEDFNALISVYLDWKNNPENT